MFSLYIYIYIFFFCLFLYVYLFPIFIGICDDLENTPAIVSINASSITKSLNDFHLNSILHPYLHLNIYPKSLDY